MSVDPRGKSALFIGSRWAGISIASALGIVLISGWALRAWVILTAPLLPGLNGGYYPVQARAILLTGLPGIPDFPLLFYIQAGLGAFLSLFTSTGQAVFSAVCLTDIFLPVLLVIPAYLFIRIFAGDRQPWYGIAAATLSVGLIAVCNGSLLRMAGDFQKNAAALPLYLFFVYFLYRSFRDFRRRDYILAALFFCLTGMTHIGVTALAAITALFAGIAGLFCNSNRGRAVKMVSLLTAALVLTLVLVSLFDIQRVTKLLRVMVNPGLMFVESHIQTWFGMNPGPGTPFEKEAVSLGNILGFLGIMTALFHPRKLESADRSILWASSLTALLFASPFFGGDWSQRLSLMAFAPGLIPLAFLAVRVRWGLVVSAAVMMVVLLTSGRDVPRLTGQGITSPAYHELASLKSSLPAGNNLVIARHGLEWWVAWAMNVKIANNVGVVLNTWEKYDAVWYLEEINPEAFSMNDMRFPGGPGGGRPPSFGDTGPRDSSPRGRNTRFPGGPGSPDGSFGPDGLNGPDGDRGFGGPGSHGGGRFGRQVGNELPAEILEPVKKGTYFQFSRITMKPEGVFDGENPRHR